MINNLAFSKRLKKVLEYYQLSASSFAEKINVQRSSISHLLSGRNKPSLDFVLKVLDNFKEVDLYWLIHGKGSFPKIEKEKSFPSTLFSDIESDLEKKTDVTKNPENIEQTTNSVDTNITSNSLLIEKIVIFYKNGTFKQFDELK